jgi:hypothetical protein
MGTGAGRGIKYKNRFYLLPPREREGYKKYKKKPRPLVFSRGGGLTI